MENLLNQTSNVGGSMGDVLTHFEAERFIEGLDAIDLKEYGSDKWFKQDELLQKINMQAHVNAMMRGDEFIMDTCVTWDKVKFLIHELVVSELWKQKVLPEIRSDIVKLNSYRSYITIYHESVLCNILEIIMYHRTAVESAEDYLHELIDYCYRKLVYLTQHPQTKKVEKKSAKDLLNKTAVEDYQDQQKDIEFQIAMMCLSIIRYISDYIKHLPIGILHHLLVETDILCILVPLIEDKPWLRINTHDEREKFENSKWVVVEKNEYNRLPKLEAQVWITIYNLFMDPECRNKYELNDFRKNNLLRLRKYMNEILLDQIPNLSIMLRSLEELSMMNVNSVQVNNPFVVQQIPQIRSQIIAKYGKQWKEIAQYQRENFFNQDQKTQQADMQRLADLYGQSVVEGLMEGFKCEKCKKEAAKRCSRCKSVWYCSRQCQLDDWPKHKATCAIQAAELKKQQEQQEQQKQQQESNVDINNIHNTKKAGIQELNSTENQEEIQQKEKEKQQETEQEKEKVVEEQKGQQQKQQKYVQEDLDELD